MFNKSMRLHGATFLMEDWLGTVVDLGVPIANQRVGEVVLQVLQSTEEAEDLRELLLWGYPEELEE